MVTKICSKCGMEKPLSEFGVDRRNPNNIHPVPMCKKCRKRYYSTVKNREYETRYREGHRERINTYAREYRKKNKERVARNLARHRSKPEVKKRIHDIITSREYKDRLNAKRKENLEEARRKANEYARKRKQIPEVRILGSLRARLQTLLKRSETSKSDRMVVLIGCTMPQLRTHLESLWKENMSWDNYGFGRGSWVIDHIIPCAKFDLTNPQEQRKCFHFSNLQPLWWEENASKSDN